VALAGMVALAAACGSRAISVDARAADDAGSGDAAPADVGEARADAPPEARETVPIVLEQPRGLCASLDLAAVAGVLYWTDEAMGQVLAASEDGSAPQVLADREDAPVRIAVAGGRVFWMAGKPPASLGSRSIAASVRMVSIGGGGATTTVVAPAEGVGGFAASPYADTVYFTTGAAVQKISTMAPPAGTPAPVDLLVPTGDVAPMGVALEGVRSATSDGGARLAVSDNVSGIVWALDLVDGQLSTCNRADSHGGAPGIRCRRSVYDNGSLLAEPILFDQGHVYWADGSVIKSWDTSTGQSGPVEESDSPLYVSSLVLAGGTIYYAAADPMRAPNLGGIGSAVPQWPPADPGAVPAPTVLASPQNGPRSVAYDGGRLFWSTADCEILSIAAGP
jgi:hypothetical protein